MGGSGLCQPQNQWLPALFQQNDGNCLEEDVGVKKEGPFLYVEVIVSDLVLGFEVVMGTNPSKSCNARLDGKPNTLQGTLTPDKIRTFWSRLYQTHIASTAISSITGEAIASIIREPTIDRVQSDITLFTIKDWQLNAGYRYELAKNSPLLNNHIVFMQLTCDF